jgi:hypothetical protein
MTNARMIINNFGLCYYQQLHGRFFIFRKTTIVADL